MAAELSICHCKDWVVRVSPITTKERRGKTYSGGMVEVLEGDTVVGRLTIAPGYAERTIMTINFRVSDPDKDPHYYRYYGRGVGTALLCGLMQSSPGIEIVESPNINSSEGDAFVARLREKGFPYHRPMCFSSIHGECVCELGGRVRERANDGCPLNVEGPSSNS